MELQRMKVIEDEVEKPTLGSDTQPTIRFKPITLDIPRSEPCASMAGDPHMLIPIRPLVEILLITTEAPHRIKSTEFKALAIPSFENLATVPIVIERQELNTEPATRLRLIMRRKIVMFGDQCGISIGKFIKHRLRVRKKADIRIEVGHLWQSTPEQQVANKGGRTSPAEFAPGTIGPGLATLLVQEIAFEVQDRYTLDLQPLEGATTAFIHCQDKNVNGSARMLTK